MTQLRRFQQHTQEHAGENPVTAGQLATRDQRWPSQAVDSTQHWSNTQDTCFPTKVTAVDEISSMLHFGHGSGSAHLSSGSRALHSATT